MFEKVESTSYTLKNKSYMPATLMRIVVTPGETIYLPELNRVVIVDIDILLIIFILLVVLGIA